MGITLSDMEQTLTGEVDTLEAIIGTVKETLLAFLDDPTDDEVEAYESLAVAVVESLGVEVSFSPERGYFGTITLE